MKRINKIYIDKLTTKNMINKQIFTLIILSVMLLGIAGATNTPISDFGNYKQNEVLTLKQTCGSCTFARLVDVSTPNGTIISINTDMSLNNNLYTYNFSNTNETGRYIVDGFGDEGGINDTWQYYFSITPTGKEVTDTGTVSVGILLFYLILGLGFTFLGFLFVRNKSSFVSYSGLFIMIIGFAFIYYDLHLSNLYATTIAINAGAGNVTSGAFLMITKFIKLAPYLVAGIIAFASVRLLRVAMKKKTSSDGWDDNKY